MSNESQREEIKDEIHQLEDIEQDDSDDKEEEEIDEKSESIISNTILVS
jgi:hypothetical protein